MQTMVDQRKLWQDTLVDIEAEVSKANFITWFKNTRIYKIESNTAVISVPNPFVRDWIQNKYHSFILKSLRSRCETIRCLEYAISKREVSQTREVKEEPRVASEQLPLKDMYVSREDGLNPRYTFENFVVGPFNELAYAASQAVIKNPGISYNPLFIYGTTGLGKTHLAQAVGNHLKKVDSNSRVYYLSAEKFAVEMVESIKNNKPDIFKERYRKYDVLILDDIQFISGKQKTQEELFHIFNTLYDKNKQIIFLSDKAPKQIPDIEDRLKSRFEGGMVVDISNPEFESRLAILKSKAPMQQINPPDEVLEYIASVVENNIRELEGFLNLVAVQTGLKKRDLTINEVKNLIKNNIKPKKTVSADDVIRTISEFYNIDEQELYSKTRRKDIVQPRQVAMYILREEFGASYPYIGRKIGHRDHTTCIHAYEKIKKDLSVNSLLAQEVDQIKGLLYENG